MSRPKTPTTTEQPLPTLPTEAELKSIGDYVIDGLSIEEACILTGFPVKDMKIIQANSPGIEDFLMKKQIEFKHNHLKEMRKKPSDKNSQWLLEKLRPNEFGPSKNLPPAGTNINIIGAILKDIQQKDSAPIVAHELISNGTK